MTAKDDVLAIYPNATAKSVAFSPPFWIIGSDLFGGVFLAVGKTEDEAWEKAKIYSTELQQKIDSLLTVVNRVRRVNETLRDV